MRIEIGIENDRIEDFSIDNNYGGVVEYLDKLRVGYGYYFPDDLIYLRSILGLTQTQAASLISNIMQEGISFDKSVVSRWESGERQPPGQVYMAVLLLASKIRQAEYKKNLKIKINKYDESSGNG